MGMLTMEIRSVWGGGLSLSPRLRLRLRLFLLKEILRMQVLVLFHVYHTINSCSPAASSFSNRVGYCGGTKKYIKCY